MHLYQQEAPGRYWSEGRRMVGRIKGMERPPLAPLDPNREGCIPAD